MTTTPPRPDLPAAPRSERDRAAFALFIEFRRVHAGLTVAAAAAAAGVSPQVFGRATSRMAVSALNFCRLCKWAGEDPSTFQTGG